MISSSGAAGWQKFHGRSAGRSAGRSVSIILTQEEAAAARERRKASGEPSKELEERDVKPVEASAGSPETEQEKIITIENDSEEENDEEDGADVINIEQMEMEKEQG